MRLYRRDKPTAEPHGVAPDDRGLAHLVDTDHNWWLQPDIGEKT